MNFILIGTSGDEFVEAGVRAALRRALTGAHEDPEAEIAVLAGPDLSDPSALRAASDAQPIVALSARMSSPPDENRLTALRDILPAWRLIVVRDRLARNVLASVGIDAPLLPSAALHAWRLHPDTASAHENRRVAVSAGLGQPDVFASALLARGFAPVVLKEQEDWFRQHDQLSGGITDQVGAAMLLAGRGAPAIVIGDDIEAMEEVSLPGYRASEAAPDIVVARLGSLINDGATRDRLMALEQRSFRAHCDIVRAALGQPDPAEALDACLTAIRRRLSAETTRNAPPPPERWVDIAPLLELDGEEFVRETYVRLLGRLPEPEGLRYWTSVLAAGTGKQECLEALAASDEARSRNVRLTDRRQSTEEFLRGIGLGCISPDSLKRWTELIDSGKLSRDEAARLIAPSVPPARVLAAIADLRRERELQLLPTER